MKKQLVVMEGMRFSPDTRVRREKSGEDMIAQGCLWVVVDGGQKQHMQVSIGGCALLKHLPQPVNEWKNI
jgi:hypothetical protein